MDYSEVQRVTAYVMGKTNLRPTLGIICGSGLGGIADELESSEVIPYEEIDGFPECTGEFKTFSSLNVTMDARALVSMVTGIY